MRAPRSPQVDTVSAILDAFAEQNADDFVSHMTDDVVLRPSAFITGRGEYRGRVDILAGFAEMLETLADAGERVQVRPLEHFAEQGDADTVLSLCRLTIFRANGEQLGTQIAYLWTLRDGKVAELDAWLDHKEGFRQLQDPVKVED